MSRSKTARNARRLGLLDDRSLRFDHFRNQLTDEEYNGNKDAINQIIDYGYIKLYNGNSKGTPKCKFLDSGKIVTFKELLDSNPQNKRRILNETMEQYLGVDVSFHMLYDPELKNPDNPLLRNTLVTPKDISSSSSTTTEEKKSRKRKKPEEVRKEGIKKIFGQVPFFKKECAYLTSMSDDGLTRNYQSTILKSGEINICASILSEENTQRDVNEKLNYLSQAINEDKKLGLPQMQISVELTSTNYCASVTMADDPNNYISLNLSELGELLDNEGISYSHETETHPGFKIENFVQDSSVHLTVFTNGTLTIVGAQSLTELFNAVREFIKDYIERAIVKEPKGASFEELKNIFESYRSPKTISQPQVPTIPPLAPPPPRLQSRTIPPQQTIPSTIPTPIIIPPPISIPPIRSPSLLPLTPNILEIPQEPSGFIFSE